MFQLNTALGALSGVATACVVRRGLAGKTCDLWLLWIVQKYQKKIIKVPEENSEDARCIQVLQNQSILDMADFSCVDGGRPGVRTCYAVECISWPIHVVAEVLQNDHQSECTSLGA